MITSRPAAGNYLTAPIVVAAGTTGAVTLGGGTLDLATFAFDHDDVIAK